MLSKWMLILLTGLIVAPACASSQDTFSMLKEKYPDLIQVTSPEKEKVQPSKIYIDSVRVISVDNRKALLIRGNLPDGCTHIGSIDHTITETLLSLSIDAWRDPGQICTQALVSFSFIYQKLPEETLDKYRSAELNGTTYSFKNN